MVGIFSKSRFLDASHGDLTSRPFWGKRSQACWVNPFLYSLLIPLGILCQVCTAIGHPGNTGAIESIPTPGDPVTAEQNPGRSVCAILSLSSALSDDAPLLFTQFSWQIFSEVDGEVLFPSLSQSGSSAETCRPCMTLLVLQIPVAELSASQQHVTATVWQPTDGGVVSWPGNEPRPQQSPILTTRPSLGDCLAYSRCTINI